MVRAAILHEGHPGKSEDNWLLKNLISELGLSESQFEFYGVRGKSNFYKSEMWFYTELQELVQDGQINKLLFVMDADYTKNDQSCGGYANTLKSWQEVTAILGFEQISSLYITCDPRTQEGYLESLLLSTLDDEKVACIQAFLDCSDFTSKENHKAILNQIYKIAYPQAPFDLKHPHFDELKTKLRELVA
ncbi:MAG: hypothetical protein JG718_13725 [Candidatus Thiothrix moscowensis]|nr:hypothetical protein [Candidatus Thiothrix moscowensis]